MKQSDFFDSGGVMTAKPTAGGWKLTSGDAELITARGRPRVFRELSTVAKVCEEQGVGGFTVIVRESATQSG